MGAVKRYYSEYLENFNLLNEADSLTIFTRFNVEQFGECNWSYEFYGVTNDDEFSLIKEESGFEILCNCQECKVFGENLFEIYSVFKALTSIKATFGNLQFSLWSSERFIKEASDNGFGRFEELYKCNFLKRLGKDLASLLSGVALCKYNNEPTVEGTPF